MKGTWRGLEEDPCAKEIWLFSCLLWCLLVGGLWTDRLPWRLLSLLLFYQFSLSWPISVYLLISFCFSVNRF